MGVAAKVTWPQALAWRMARQFLDPLGHESVEGVVGRLGAVQAQSEFGYDLSINTRRQSSTSGDVTAAFLDGRLIKSFAFRGATHLMTPEVVLSGVVSGTWTLKNDLVRVEWFAEAGAIPRDALEAEVARLGKIVGKELWLDV